uniref:ANK_REP_REGION domain-containing protein n=1 Tax=Mesocestoides corti TaxID=53468 RepID=A0A5K3EWG0_MESCO
MADCLLHDAPDIIQAIFIGDKSMLQFPPSTDDVNYRDSHRRTPLHAAAYCGEAEVVEFLLKHNARVNVKDAKWYTPLHRACASNASSVVKLLLENGADRNVREKCWLTPLHVAAINGSLECARLLLLHSSGEGGSGANVNASDRGGHTPLHHAVYGGHYELVRLLLSNGASVNAFDKNDRRAMHWAASCDLISIIDLLCEFGAEVNCRDKSQYTPLHVSAALGHVNVAKQLIERGAELGALTTRGNTPLHIACLNGQKEMVALLLQSLSTQSRSVRPEGAESADDKHGSLLEAIALQNADDYSPLHLSVVTSGDGGCVEQLISAITKRGEGENSVPLDLETPGGSCERTPLHLAAAYGRYRRARMLIDLGANVAARDRWGNTPLHLAAGSGHELVMNTLLQAGARWDTPGDSGATALHCAASAGFALCFTRLMEVAVKEWDALLDVKKKSLDCGDKDYPRHYRFVRALKDDRGRNLVHAAALGGSIDCLRCVLLHGADPFEVDNDGRSPLHLAMISGSLENTQAPRLADPSGPRRHSSQLSKSNVSVETVRVLLKLGVDPNAADVHGCTALHLAAAYDTDGCLVRLLLKHGANRYAVASWPSGSQEIFPGAGSSTPSEVAGSVDETPRGGGPPHKPSASSSVDQALAAPVYYPLHLAASTGNAAAVTCLLEGLSSVEACRLILDSASMTPFSSDGPKSSNEPSRYFYSPLFLAACRGQTDCIEVLLDACTTKSTQSEEDIKLEQERDERGGHKAILSKERPCGELADPLGRTPLHYAAHAGHLDACRLLVRHPLSRADPGTKDGVYQWNAVHHSASQGHVAVVNFFLRWQMDQQEKSNRAPTQSLADVPDEHGRTALMLAAQNRHPGVIELLTTNTSGPASKPDTSKGTQVSHQSMRDVNVTDSYGRTALHRAAANGHTECMKLLLSAGASLTIADFRGRQALHLAASGGQVHSIEFLLRALVRSFSGGTGEAIGDETEGSSEALARLLCPNDSRGFTPLHLAAFSGHLECLQSLIQCRAYRQLRGNTFSPLHCAATRGHVGCLECLLKTYGVAGLKLQDFKGRAPLHIAAMSNHLESLDCILDYLAEKATGCLSAEDALSLCDSRGCTPLMLATRAGAMATCQRLLSVLCVESDASPLFGKTDSDGQTILHHALLAPNEQTSLFLLQRIQDNTLLNRPNSCGLTPLHLAVKAGYHKSVSILLSRGANVFAVDNRGQLPICAVSQSDQASKCLTMMLLSMMPNLRNKLPPGALSVSSGGGGDNDDQSPRTSHNLMGDSIHSSDSEFF